MSLRLRGGIPVLRIERKGRSRVSKSKNKGGSKDFFSWQTSIPPPEKKGWRAKKASENWHRVSEARSFGLSPGAAPEKKLSRQQNEQEEEEEEEERERRNGAGGERGPW